MHGARRGQRQVGRTTHRGAAPLFLPTAVTTKMSPDVAKCPLGDKNAPAEDHCCPQAWDCPFCLVLFLSLPPAPSVRPPPRTLGASAVMHDSTDQHRTAQDMPPLRTAEGHVRARHSPAPTRPTESESGRRPGTPWLYDTQMILIKDWAPGTFGGAGRASGLGPGPCPDLATQMHFRVGAGKGVATYRALPHTCVTSHHRGVCEHIPSPPHSWRREVGKAIWRPESNSNHTTPSIKQDLDKALSQEVRLLLC